MILSKVGLKKIGGARCIVKYLHKEFSTRKVACKKTNNFRILSALVLFCRLSLSELALPVTPLQFMRLGEQL
jgi:hypothetical protein